jgi:hypothetical protein
MYFEVKAFKGIKRRFENLDNIEELNVFFDKFQGKGYNKFIVKSFDQLGFRKRIFFVCQNDQIKELVVKKN